MSREIKKILIVDDDPDFTYIMKKFLEKKNYSVIESHSGLDALDEIKTSNPDLVFMDIMMPKMDGWETCSKIKEDPETKDIPVIMLSVKKFYEDKIKSIEEYKANDHLGKPLNWDKIDAVLNKHL